MVIPPLPSRGPAVLPTRPRRRAGDPAEAFAGPDKARPADAGPTVAEAAPLAAMTGLLAMQEASSSATDAAAARHGEAVLGQLGSLQIELLRGAGGVAAAALASLARNMPAGASPGLAEVLRAVQLRAEIEAARRRPAGTAAMRHEGDT